MKKTLTIGGALLAFVAFASTADARMMGGGMSMPSSMSRGDSHPTFNSPRGSDIGSFRTSGPSFDPGLQSRVKGSNWKHPIDSDNGGRADPPNKPPKGSTQGSSGDGQPKENPYDPTGFHKHHPGYVDQYGHYHPPTTVGSSDPAPASRKPR